MSDSTQFLCLYCFTITNKQLTDCIKQVEHIESRVKEKEPFLLIPPSPSPQEQQMKEEEQPQQEGEEYVANTGTLDRYFIIINKRTK